MVACSGGADSVALLACLASVDERVVVAHVLHDLRPKAAAAADRDFVAGLAAALGLEYAEAAVRVSGKPGNAEGLARQSRYRALTRLARERGCRWVAVAHHADDQLETVLMALLRGAGARGLGGMPASRALARRSAMQEGVGLIRPMLEASVGGVAITRIETRAICRLAGVEWREDATNADTGRLRAAVRHEVVPLLAKIRPGVQGRAAAGAAAVREAAGVVAGVARRVFDETESGLEARRWGRARLRREPTAVLFEVIRRAHLALAGRAGLDGLTRRAVGPVVRAIVSAETNPRAFSVGRVVVRVAARDVTIQAVTGGAKEC